MTIWAIPAGAKQNRKEMVQTPVARRFFLRKFIFKLFAKISKMAIFVLKPIVPNVLV